ncbi:MAG: AAC(3) family N-acetyltransferase [Candidatus Zixiibacteriota bacterium]
MILLSALKQNLRIWAKKFLPTSIIQALRRISDRADSQARRARVESMPEVSKETLLNDLSEAGISPGDIIMVHSSLSRIGKVSGGADAVIDALLETITDEGTLIMPCYGSADEAFKSSKKGEPVDLRTAKSAVGKITEVFRVRKGVLRSSHPFSSSCAVGKHAEYITSGHDAGPDVCHADSPVGRLVELEGRVVGIGIPIAQGLGVAHFLEDTWDDFPFEVHSDRASITYIDADGKETTRDVSRYDPKISRTRVDYPDGQWICKTLTEHMIRVGLMKQFKFGQADSWLMEARALYDELKRLAQKGVTMYLTEDGLSPENRDVLNW